MAEGTGDIKGLSTSGLQESPSDPGATFQKPQKIKDWMLAAKQNFGANTMRLQVQQQSMVGEKGDQVDSTYARAYAAKVDEVVRYGINHGLTIVIDCTTEGWEKPRAINWPNQKNNGTNAFWKHFASTPWNGHPQVIFDIFNEPDGRPKWPKWSVWQANMQALVNYLRNTLHVTNVLWADADKWSASFDDCPGLTDPMATWSIRSIILLIPMMRLAGTKPSANGHRHTKLSTASLHKTSRSTGTGRLRFRHTWTTWITATSGKPFGMLSVITTSVIASLLAGGGT
jgi:hypothetical protein